MLCVLKGMACYAGQLLTPASGIGSCPRLLLLANKNIEKEEEKSRKWETKHLSTDADSNTDTKKILLVRQNLPNKQIFFLKSLDIGLREVGSKRRLNEVNK